MKITCTFNGHSRILLEPENQLELVHLQTMAEASEKGATTVLAMPATGDKTFVLEVGQK